jgi:Secretion system C-terminal sorting domain
LKKLLHTVILSLVLLPVFAQARLVIDNGGIININGGTSGTSIYLVIDNPNANAITRNVSGHIISEGEFNKIKWNIGTTAGTYLIPYGIGAATYIPNQITTSGAAGATGTFTFSTYPTPTWLNSAFRPTGVLHVNSYLGFDNSYSVIDRFWRIEAENYTTKPALSNMLFSYQDIEWSAASNIITEANLIAQRYNDVTDDWDDYMPGGTDNTALNNVSGAAVPNAPTQQLYTWWTLVDFQSPLPVELTSFNAKCEGDAVKLLWETASETNNNYFEIERSADATQFIAIGKVYSLNGNSPQPQAYEFLDTAPLSVPAYYRLKQVDTDGRTSYSAIVRVACASQPAAQPVVSIYPNPAVDELTVEVKNLPGEKRFIIYNLLGQDMTLKKEIENDVTVKFDVAAFAKATYILHLDVDGKFYQAIKFIKE